MYVGTNVHVVFFLFETHFKSSVMHSRSSLLKVQLESGLHVFFPPSAVVCEELKETERLQGPMGGPGCCPKHLNQEQTVEICFFLF